MRHCPEHTPHSSSSPLANTGQKKTPGDMIKSTFRTLVRSGARKGGRGGLGGARMAAVVRIVPLKSGRSSREIVIPMLPGMTARKIAPVSTTTTHAAKGRLPKVKRAPPRGRTATPMRIEKASRRIKKASNKGKVPQKPTRKTKATPKRKVRALKVKRTSRK